MPDTQLSAPQTLSVGTILHVGAGAGRMLPDYLDEQPTEIVIVDPDPLGAQLLRPAIAAEQPVRLINAALADRIGKATLIRYTLPELSGLQPVTGLQDIFPGLRETDRIPVAATTLKHVMAMLLLPRQAENRLVLRAFGQEKTVLTGLSALASLDRFSRIDLHCSVEAVRDDSWSMVEILDYLDSHDFTPEADLSDGDPDRCHLRLRLSPHKAARDRAKRQLADLLKEKAIRDKELQTAQRRVTELGLAQAVADDELRTLEQQLEAAQTASSIAQADHADLQERFETLFGENQRLRAVLAEIAGKLRSAAACLADRAPHGKAADGTSKDAHPES